MLVSKDGFFWDREGARVRLKGINLSGAAKSPSPQTDSYEEVPFSVEDADTHFCRLKGLGFNAIRFLVTWDAIERKGPGQYDEGYIDYVDRLLKKAGSYGFYILLDLHQDLFSRYFFGSGAPAWAIEAAGINLEKVVKADAVIHPQHHEEKELKHLNWFNAYQRIACQTMFTLFFGGNTFAPKLLVDGRNIQDFLQDHYIAAFDKLLLKLQSNPWIIGFNTMNEPNPGLIGASLKESHMFLDLGITPSPYQSILIGAGLSQSVPFIKFSLLRRKEKEKRVLNPEKIPIWKERCLWEEHGVYEIGNDGYPVLLQPNYFKKGKKASFEQHFYRPFVLKMYERLMKKYAQWNFFVEQGVGELPPFLGEEKLKNLVASVHYYEPFTMVFKQYIPLLHYSIFFKKLRLGFPFKISKAVLEDFKHIDQENKKRLGKDAPTVVTETGVTRDVGRFLFEDGSKQRLRAFHRTLSVMDQLDLNYFVWQYAPKGDLWNHENFTIYQEGEKNDYTPFLAPHVELLPGYVTFQSFDPFKKHFILRFWLLQSCPSPVRIWVPSSFDYVSGSFTLGQFQIVKEESKIEFYPDSNVLQHQIKIQFRHKS
ncbi:MAG: glycoside hydrolase family 5 protein [Chlamydiae bacterium]|nr:glycoside hydrolase family 5 protein [Chlamydiota bacterium]